MTITITDEELDRRLVETAHARGETVDEFVVGLVRQRLGTKPKLGPKKIDWVGVRELQDQVASMPVLEEGTADELLYDADGLPH